MNAGDGNRLGPTRVGDLLAVGVVAAVIVFGLTWLNYSHIPALPRLAGVPAVLIGIGEAIAGHGLRSRIRDAAKPAETRVRRPPVPPLTAARALAVAKATALAGAALAGLWLGFGAYVLPDAGAVTAAGADTVTAVIGLACAAVMLAGALFLEHCCRAPQDPSAGPTAGG
jgi:hypothetical protein